MSLKLVVKLNQLWGNNKTTFTISIRSMNLNEKEFLFFNCLFDFSGKCLCKFRIFHFVAKNLFDLGELISSAFYFPGKITNLGILGIN